MALKQTCGKPGCCRAIDYGTRYCEYHAKTEPSKQAQQERSRHRSSEPTPAKREAARLYGTKRWQEMRLAQLQAEPLCERCIDKDRVTAATVVDHIDRHGNDERRFYDRGNLQSLCKRCHDKKTMTEDYRARRAESERW